MDTSHSTVARLLMVTPFDSSLGALAQDQQVLMLKGCALCTITRDLDSGTTRNKPEWKQCKAELGVPVVVYTQDTAPAAVMAAAERSAPAVLAETGAGAVSLLMDKAQLERCRGSVADFRGRLRYRLETLGLTME